MGGENLDATALVKQRLARFVSFHHILRISMISSYKINTTNLLNSIQNNLFQKGVRDYTTQKKKKHR